jgi:restriction system protein
MAEPLCDKQGVVAIGWKDIGDLSGLKTREDFKSRYVKAYPTDKAGAVPLNVGQLYCFIHEMKVGDAILLRRAHTREISLSWVKGEYEYNPKLDPAFPHLRKVQWVKNEPRTKFHKARCTRSAPS